MQFEVEQVDIEYIFKTIHKGSTRLFLGPSLSKLLIERQKDFIKNPQAFVQALKVGLSPANLEDQRLSITVRIYDTFLLQPSQHMP